MNSDMTSWYVPNEQNKTKLVKDPMNIDINILHVNINNLHVHIHKSHTNISCILSYIMLHPASKTPHIGVTSVLPI